MHRLSFVIPTKDRVEWLPLCLQSLLSQTETDIEIVVVNDASEDDTKLFLDTWAVKDPRVKVIHNEKPMGAGQSRNIGCDAATSEIIAVCDDDDVYINTRARDILSWFEKHPESELVTFPYVSIDYFDDILEEFRGAPFDHKLFMEKSVVTYFSNPSSAHKKKSAQEIGGYPSETNVMTDDFQFLKNWVEAGKKVDFCGNDGEGNVPFTTMHRILPDSMMSKHRGFDPNWLVKKQEDS